MPPYFAWQALSGQGWPASYDQEEALVAGLRRAASTSGTPTAATVVLVLNVLRCGTTWTDLAQLLPGVAEADLVATYDLLSQLLADSSASWQAVIAEPAYATLVEHGPRAALLMPKPMQRIWATIGSASSPDQVHRRISEAIETTGRVQAAVAAVEERLARTTPGSPRGIELGRRLFDPTNQDALWAHPFFLPSRVGQLSTGRLRDLTAGLPLDAPRSRPRH